VTPPPSFSQLFYIALTKSLNNGYQDYYYLSEIVEALGEYKLVEIKKGKPPKFSKKSYHAVNALNEIFSRWMLYLNLVTYSKDDNRIVNTNLIELLLSKGVTFENIKKLPSYSNFINFFSFHYALNQYSYLENSFNEGEYIDLEQSLNNVLYGDSGDPILNCFLNELKSRLRFNLNHYERFSYIPNLKKESLSPLNRLKVACEIRVLANIINNESPKTMLEELDNDFQLIRQDAPYHLNHLKFNDSISNTPAHLTRIEHETFETKVLKRIKQMSPTQFEHFAPSLIKSKYGAENIEFIHNGKVGDGGIDGILRTKKAIGDSFDEYYIQCKRYNATSIGIRELRDFIGAMAGYEAVNGIFITTSYFTKSAIEYINSLPKYDITLINGEQLVNDVIEFKIGLKTIPQAILYEIDNDFFNKFPIS